MQKTWVWPLGQEDPLQKGLATLSSILVWRIWWTVEPGGLKSMGSQRVGHDWTTNTFTFFQASIYKLLKFQWLSAKLFEVNRVSSLQFDLFGCQIFILTLSDIHSTTNSWELIWSSFLKLSKAASEVSRVIFTPVAIRVRWLKRASSVRPGQTFHNCQVEEKPFGNNWESWFQSKEASWFYIIYSMCFLSKCTTFQ